MDDESIRSEIAFRFTRSSGPGGQHAQKSSTRAEALFDVEESLGLSEAERKRVLTTDRILEQLKEAVKVRRRRKPTKPSAAAREQRLDEKKRRGQTKRL